MLVRDVLSRLKEMTPAEKREAIRRIEELLSRR